MRLAVSRSFACTFPDFAATRVELEAPDSRQAAIRAVGWWEEDINDFRVLRGEETLRVHIQANGIVSLWDVLGVQERYVAKAGERSSRP